MIEIGNQTGDGQTLKTFSLCSTRHEVKFAFVRRRPPARHQSSKASCCSDVPAATRQRTTDNGTGTTANLRRWPLAILSCYQHTNRTACIDRTSHRWRSVVHCNCRHSVSRTSYWPRQNTQKRTLPEFFFSGGSLQHLLLARGIDR